MQVQAQNSVTVVPDACEPEIYRQLWSDLSELNDEELRVHYQQFGIGEGRQANGLFNRKDFAALIPADAECLEIGPFHNPLLKGAGTKYFDVMDKVALEDRARVVGGSPSGVPEIDYVSPTGNLSIVSSRFDYVLSSHCIEHQPDLIVHLKQVSRLLRPSGKYFLLVPDKRFCFDALLPETTVADVLHAHHCRRRLHTLQSVIEHRAFTTHNDGSRHWAGDHGQSASDPQVVLDAVDEFVSAAGGYIDVHAWCFTPVSAQSLFRMLRKTKYIDLEIEVIYPTRRNAIEFWMVLRKCGV